MITKIVDIAAAQDKDPIAELHGKVVEVYAVQSVGGKPKQDFLLDDGVTSVKGSAWGFKDDISYYKGKDVVIRPGAKGGLSVNVYNNKKSFNMSATCTFQLAAVHAAQTGHPLPVAGKTPEAGGLTPIRGDMVGNALKNVFPALAEIVGLDDPTFYKKLAYHTSRFIELSNWFQAGHLVPKTPTEAGGGVKTVVAALPPATTATTPDTAQGEGEDVPF